MSLALEMRFFQLLQAAAALFLAWRLLHFHLQSEMRAMLVLQFWTAVYSVGVIFLYSNEVGYFYFYTLIVIPSCIVNILAVRELFALVFERYPGIRTMARWVMYAAVGLAVVATLLFARLFWINPRSGARYLYWVVLERSVSFSLAIFIVCVLYLLSRYPFKLPRNFSVSSVLFCLVFLSEALVLLIDTLDPKLHNPALDIAQTVFCALCLASWGYMLQPAESRPAAPPPRRQGGDEQAMLDQLDHLNRMMGRVVRR